MYLEFYGLKEQPFGVTPDPRYLFFGAGHQEALASLYYGIQAGRGFVALVAPPGMGKTTLLFRLLECLQGMALAKTVYLFQTQCSSRDLFRYMLADLGLESKEQDIVRLHARLNDALLDEAKAGRQIVLIIDEAQNLKNSVLETVRLLSDFETPERKLLQIVLAGQPELASKLLHRNLVQLRQRISLLCRLRPLAPPEIGPYIDHRLQVAGYTGNPVFDPEALALIAEHSQGIPRIINNICFHALSLGCATGRSNIGPGIMREVLADLIPDSGAEPQRVCFPLHAPNSVPCEAPPPVRTEEPQPSSMPVIPRRVDKSWLGAALRLFVVGVLGLTLGYSAKSFLAPVRGSQQGPPEQKVVEASGKDTNDNSARIHRSSASDVASEGNIVYNILPNDTLEGVCLRVFGRYDAQLLRAILELNPQITNPDRIVVGQSIQLPSADSERAARTASPGPAPGALPRRKP